MLILTTEQMSVIAFEHDKQGLDLWEGLAIHAMLEGEQG